MSTKILIVDDEDNIREILHEYFDALGYHIFEACDGEEALNIYLSENEIAVVITDIRMPNMNGLQLLDAIKQKNPNQPVILMTGYDLSKNEIANLTHQPDGYVTKPFNLTQMLNHVKAFVN
jgi:CheY-like chemotaxis protein